MKLITLMLCALALASAKTRYDGYQVFRLNALTDDHTQMVRAMRENVELDFWSNTDVMVPPHMQEEVTRMLNDADLIFEVINSNVQEELDAEEEVIASRQGKAYNLNGWNTYAQIVDAIHDFVSSCPTGYTCTKESMGSSYEGRDIPALKIDSPSSEKVVYLDSLAHSREWLTGSTVLLIADRLINEQDAETTRMRSSYDWYIAPVINPDGYEYTFTTNRLWRKNRQPNSGSTCVGTDLNRNFDASWMYSGTSTNPCSDTYGGPSAASAPETVIVQDVLTRLGQGTLYGVVSYHAYGKMWLHAYGYTTLSGGSVCATSPHFNEINRVAGAAADAVEQTGGQSWVYGPVCSVIYPASGSTVDYCHDKVGSEHAYTPELRGNSFSPPTSEIDPSFKEQWAGLVAMVDAI